MAKVRRCTYLSVLPVSGVGHGVRRRQRLVRPHRVSGAHRPSFQHDTPRPPAAGGCPSASPAHPHRTASLTHCTRSITAINTIFSQLFISERAKTDRKPPNRETSPSIPPPYTDSWRAVMEKLIILSTYLS